MFRQRFSVVVLLTLAAFAGCIQAESTAAPPASGGQAPIAAGPAEFDETTGAITGSITTTDLAPVAGAQVGILPSDIITQQFLVMTDVAGQFTFSHVPPGTHTLQASALGFEAVSKRATVEAGAAVTTQFILTELPSDEPYMNTIMEPVQFTSIMYKATPFCIYEPLTTVNPSVKTCGGVRVGGTITDDELQPIAGAIVGVLPSETLTEPLQVLSDQNGKFSFSNVPPGTHTVAGSALGYTSASRSVEVQVGVVTDVAMIVEKLAAEGAYSVTEVYPGTVTAYMYRATPTCMYFASYIPPETPGIGSSRNLVKTCGGAGSASFGQLHWIDEFYKETEWRTIVAELAWQPQSAATGKGFLMDVSAPNITRSTGGSIDQTDPHTWVQMAGKSPLHIRIDNPTSLVERNLPELDWYSYPDGEGCTAPDADNNGNCDWFLRLFGAYCDISSNLGDCWASPVDFGLPQDLPVTLYFSYFYTDPAEEGFTALPDA